MKGRTVVYDPKDIILAEIYNHNRLKVGDVFEVEEVMIKGYVFVFYTLVGLPGLYPSDWFSEGTVTATPGQNILHDMK